MIYPNPALAIDAVIQDFRNCNQIIKTEKWQGTPTKPEMATYELLNYTLKFMMQHESPTLYGLDIEPNLPWADDHFSERVCGEPINPGEQWKHWPWGNHADKFRDENGKFNHNYMERYWPKFAGKHWANIENGESQHKGIRYNYGDLNDIVVQLLSEPNTRQAYLPIFFPEDTGAVHGGRVPCSLGYHFIHRNGYLHINYYLRSCEVYRHFRDDVYLTIRLLLWVLNQLRETDSHWNNVKPGIFTMHITSFHCFINDKEKL